MCTVTWSLRASGYDLVFSRDERLTRSLAIPPAARMLNGTRVVYPLDPDGGGTWLSVSEFGLSVCLINEYESDAPRAASEEGFSRGRIVLQLAGCTGLVQLRSALYLMELANFAPFRLCALAPREPAFQAIWTGKKLVECLGGPAFITSSSYRPDHVQTLRREKFEAFRARLDGAPSGDELMQFHRAPSNNPAVSVAMRRPDSATVSVSRVQVTPESISLHYFPGHPHAPKPEPPTVCELSPIDPAAQEKEPVRATQRTFDIGRLAGSGLEARLRGRALLKGMRWVLKERELNDWIFRLGDVFPKQFPARALQELGVTARVRDMSGSATEAPVYVANHPLGGIDGLALLAWILSRHGDAVVPVNSVLAELLHLRPFSVGLERGRPRRRLAQAMHEVFERGAPVLIFPAGATSRPKRGNLQDPPWSSAALRLAERYGRPVVPIFVSGRNSNLFYGLSLVRRALGVTTNLEMFLLPRETLRPKQQQIQVNVGAPLSSRERRMPMKRRLRTLRERCYALGTNVTGAVSQ